jgi:hypothetical protein
MRCTLIFILLNILSVAYSGTEEKPDPVPVKWNVNEIPVPLVLEDDTFRFKLNESSFFLNPDDLKFRLEIKKQTPGNWISLSSRNELTGSPKRENVGVTQLQVVVISEVKGTSHSDPITLKIEVKAVNKPPQWKKNRVFLGSFHTGKPITVTDFKTNASDPDQDKLRFEWNSSKIPMWMNLTPEGVLSGIPTIESLGKNEFTLAVSDKELKADCEISFEVTNDPPQWKQSTLVLKPHPEGSLLEFSLASVISDFENDKITFEAKRLPEWLQLDDKGILKGTPTRENVGKNTFQIRASDGDHHKPVELPVEVNVLLVNKPPQWKNTVYTHDPIKERDPFVWKISEGASDPDPKDYLQFVKVSGPEWIQVTPDGQIKGTPLRANVGIQKLTIAAIDSGKLKSEATFEWEVLKVNRPPTWSDKKTVFQAIEEKKFEYDLKPLVEDLDKDKLYFSSDSLPDWLTLQSSGLLTGTPINKDLGT